MTQRPLPPIDEEPIIGQDLAKNALERLGYSVAIIGDTLRPVVCRACSQAEGSAVIGSCPRCGGHVYPDRGSLWLSDMDIWRFDRGWAGSILRLRWKVCETAPDYPNAAGWPVVSDDEGAVEAVLAYISRWRLHPDPAAMRYLRAARDRRLGARSTADSSLIPSLRSNDREERQWLSWWMGVCSECGCVPDPGYLVDLLGGLVGIRCPSCQDRKPLPLVGGPHECHPRPCETCGIAVVVGKAPGESRPSGRLACSERCRLRLAALDIEEEAGDRAAGPR